VVIDIYKAVIAVSKKAPHQVPLSDAAMILEIHPDTIRRWEKKGLIKCERVQGGKRLFSLEELKRTNEKYLLGGKGSRAFKILKSESKPYKVIELFAGCGGLALGLENAGFQTELLVEKDRDCVATLRKNFTHLKEAQIMGEDVTGIDFSKWHGLVDVVSGGFPCQSFSYAGHGKGFGDTRGTLFFDFARCVEQVRPKIAFGENVRGLQMHDSGRTLKTMITSLQDLGYNVYTHLVRAQFHDVPQKRERLFIIGLEKSIDHGAFFPKENNYTVSLREALKGCPKTIGQKYPPKKARVMALVPAGGYWKDLPPKIQREYMGGSYLLGGGKTGMARRLSWDEPSLTLTCNPAQKQTERGHPSENRPLNIGEYARIQTFPYEWKFMGSISSQYRQIGNAVPVNLGYHIGKCLTAMLENKFDEEKMVQGVRAECK
jgi:DNA (cytosine-5)-methyltransferase 1